MNEDKRPRILFGNGRPKAPATDKFQVTWKTRFPRTSTTHLNCPSYLDDYAAGAIGRVRPKAPAIELCNRYTIRFPHPVIESCNRCTITTG
jgi:hypothetical protein